MRLEEKQDDSETVLAVQQATGGWPCFLDRLFALSERPKEMDLKAVLPSLQRWLEDPDTRKSVLQNSGFADVPPVVQHILSCISREGAIPGSWIKDGLYGERECGGKYSAPECCFALDS
jgi:hypothetical protein